MLLFSQIHTDGGLLSSLLQLTKTKRKEAMARRRAIGRLAFGSSIPNINKLTNKILTSSMHMLSPCCYSCWSSSPSSSASSSYYFFVYLIIIIIIMSNGKKARTNQTSPLFLSTHSLYTYTQQNCVCTGHKTPTNATTLIFHLMDMYISCPNDLTKEEAILTLQ